MKQIQILRARLYGAINSRLLRIKYGPLKYLAKPEFLCIKLTERCNSRCVHCNIWHNSDINGELGIRDWIRVINDLRSWTGPANLVITGGEALLRSDALDIVRHACNVGMIVEVLSNGIVCDDQICEQIVLSGINQITFSLDGATATTHDSIRGISNNFTATTKAVQGIVRYREKYGKNIKVLLKTVIMSKNLHEVLPIGKWINSLNNILWRVQPIEQTYQEKDDPMWYKTSNLWINDHTATDNLVSQLKQRKAQGYPLQNDFNSLDLIASYFRKPDHFMRSVQSHNLPGQAHTAPTNFEISSRGEVRFSYILPSAGNIASHSPKAIWKKRFQFT